MPRLLIVHHTPSPAMQAMFEAVVKGARYALYVHGNLDTTGAVRSVEAIATGLKWRRARPPVCVTGSPAAADLAACWELGATFAGELSS